MDVNLALEVNSGNARRANRPGSLVRRRSSQRFEEPEFEPKIEWVDTPEAHILVAHLPGFKKEDVKLQVDLWGNITISGERCVQELVFVGGVWHPRERTRYFKKVFGAPENANTEDITARFENEMLYVMINKLKPLPKIKAINILDQGSKSIPKAGESSGKVVEESNEKKDNEVSSNKADQNKTPRNEKDVAQESTQMKETQLENTNKREEMAKHLMLLNEDNPTDSNNLQEKLKSLNQKEAEIKVDDHHEEKHELKDSNQEEAKIKPSDQHEENIKLVEYNQEGGKINAGDKYGSMDSKQKVAEIKASDQHDEDFLQKPTVESSHLLGDQNISHPLHEGQIKGVELEDQRAKEGYDHSSGSDVQEEDECGEEKHLPKVSRFMLSRHDVLVASAIILFSFTLYFTYKLWYLED